MKNRLVRLLLLAVVIFATTSVAPGQTGTGACHLNTLNGAYGFESTGTLIFNNAPVPFAAVGLLRFDGRGNFSAMNTISIGGTILRWIPADGTYTVNEDCTGSAISNGDGAILDLVIVDNGKRLLAIAAVADQIVTATLTRI